MDDLGTARVTERRVRDAHSTDELTGGRPHPRGLGRGDRRISRSSVRSPGPQLRSLGVTRLPVLVWPSEATVPRAFVSIVLRTSLLGQGDHMNTTELIERVAAEHGVA